MTERMKILIGVLAFVLVLSIDANGQNKVVADSASHSPISYASVFNRNGKLIGQSERHGEIPWIAPSEYPITIRYMGYKERIVNENDIDTIFLQENVTELPEVIVESRNRKVLHMLAYVREYSTLTSFTDTIFMFREKTVDFMMAPEGRSSFKGWRKPRVLASKSYFQFTDTEGTDSVSDVCDYHFSWSDWVGILPSIDIPAKLFEKDIAADTIYGKYSPTEIWLKSNDRLKVDVDVLADTMSRKWVPALSSFFHHDLDFDMFKLHFNYNDAGNKTILPVDLLGYSFIIESTGRGHDMYMFNNNSPSYFVRTYAEVYILDKSYIKISEAKKWERRQMSARDIDPYLADVPELSADIITLIDRVNHIDKDAVRLNVQPDHRLGSFREKRSLGQSIWRRLKNMIGL
ncbi:MAG: hypothetical protein K2M54_00435 [Muribaculaceae bacterium]|nr:hypothetical protein [Muribaculaceae bacterium]